MSVFLVAFGYGGCAVPPPPQVYSNPQSPVPNYVSDLGETRNTPVPLGTSLKIDFPSYVSADQELTVLGAGSFKSPFKRTLVCVKIRIKSIGPEATAEYSHLDFGLVGSKGVIYQPTSVGVDSWKKLLTGSSLDDRVLFAISGTDDDFIFVWEPYYSETQPLFFALGEVKLFKTEFEWNDYTILSK